VAGGVCSGGVAGGVCSGTVNVGGVAVVSVGGVAGSDQTTSSAMTTAAAMMSNVFLSIGCLVLLPSKLLLPLRWPFPPKLIVRRGSSDHQVVAHEVQSEYRSSLMVPSRRSDGRDASWPHILRHTFASVAGDLRYLELTIGALLGRERDLSLRAPGRGACHSG
jgi:hypothetical protein